MKITLHILSEMNRACSEIRTRTEKLRELKRSDITFGNEKLVEEIEVRVKELLKYVDELKK